MGGTRLQPSAMASNEPKGSWRRHTACRKHANGLGALLMVPLFGGSLKGTPGENTQLLGTVALQDMHTKGFENFEKGISLRCVSWAQNEELANPNSTLLETTQGTEPFSNTR